MHFSQLWVSPEEYTLLLGVPLGVRTDLSIVLENTPCVISLLAPGLKNLRGQQNHVCLQIQEKQVMIFTKSEALPVVSSLCNK